MTTTVQPLPPFRAMCLLLISLAALVQSGCSVVMAARLPPERDLSVLTPGVSRTRVVAELGKPLASYEKPYGSMDVFAFKQGYPAPVKYSRLMLHSAADILTWGLWEIIGTSVEASFQGEQVRAEVAYSEDGTVQRVEYFSGAHLAHGAPALAGWMRRKSTQQTAVVGNFPAAASPGDSDIMQAGAQEPTDAAGNESSGAQQVPYSVGTEPAPH